MSTTHASELALSMHADRALPAAEAVALERHLAGCTDCRARLAAVRDEAGIVAAALAHDEETVPVPAYRPPVSRLAMAATAAGGLGLALLLALLPDLIGGLLEGPVAWFNPFDAESLADLGIETALYLAKHGGAIVTSLAKTALMAVGTALIGWFALRRRGRSGGPLLLAALVCAGIWQPLPVHALDVRRDENQVFIAAEETIDDTLIVAAETVEIAGNVTGDLIAVGRRVVVRGRVGGQVFTAANTIEVEGEVGGSVLALTSGSVTVASRIAGNLMAAGPVVEVRPAGRVEANALMAGEQVRLAGAVGRDAFAAGDDVDVNGSIGGAFTAFAENIALLAAARVGGDLTAYVKKEGDLNVAPTAVIGGVRQTYLRQESAPRNEYLSVDFYVTQLLYFLAAFATGAVLLALLPKMRDVAVNGPRHALIAGGVGLVVLVATPLIAILVAVTLIGLPLGIIALLLWGVALYAAKLVVAHFVGTRLLKGGEPRHFALALAAGLAIVIVLINLPFVGGLLNFALTIIGVGLLVDYLRGAYDERAYAA